MPRWVIGLAAGAIVLVSQAGHAQQVSSFQGDVTAPASLPSGPAGNFRLHASLAMPMAIPNVIDEGALRHRMASSMIEFYPVEASGFHLSAGARYFARRHFATDAQRSTGDLLFAPRGSGARGPARRFTPAMTVGYSAPIDRDMSIGVEAGTLMGRAFASAPGLGSRGYGATEDNHSSAINPIANLVFAARF